MGIDRSAKVVARSLLASVILGALTLSADSQSSPGLVTGQTPTASQWNSYFSAKTNYPLSPLTLDGKAYSLGNTYVGAHVSVFNSTVENTESTTTIMGGYGSSFQFTPGTTGIVLITVSSICQAAFVSETLTDVKVQLAYGTGTPPSSGAAATGTAVGGAVSYYSVPSTTGAISATPTYGCSQSYVLTGLTTGTTYWVDWQWSCSTASADCSIAADNFSAVEIP